jgi:hypothetical protein
MVGGARNRRGADNTTVADDLDHIELSKDGKLIVEAITRKFDELTLRFSEMKEEFRAEIAKKDEQVSGLQEEVDALKLKVSGMEEKVDDADAYERRDTLIFSGSSVPLVTEDENCGEIVRKLVKDKLNLNMAATDISTTHRLGRKPVTQKQDTRNIVVKLCRRDLKGDLLSACRQLKPDNLYINESLTPNRSTILYALRKAKRQFPDKVSGTGTMNGRVCVWVKPPNPETPLPRNSRMFVNTRLTLESFCTDILGVPSSTLIENWPGV